MGMRSGINLAREDDVWRTLILKVQWLFPHTGFATPEWTRVSVYRTARYLTRLEAEADKLGKH